MTLSRSLLPPAALLAVALAGSAGPPDPELDGVRQVGQEFAKAFARGDSAAVAALWTDRGEYEDDRGTLVHGRDEIAKLYEAYFKEHPGGRLEIRPASVRLLARDAAVEEGVLRSVRPGAELPTSSLYRVFLVREEGRWRIAQVREWDSSRDRLEDLEWLLGTWKASAKDQDVTLTVTRHPKLPQLTGELTRAEKGRVVSTASLKIALDPQRGRLRSWHFDADGGQGQALWLRDGDRWVLEATGTLADGTPTASTDVLTRTPAGELLWRSVERVLGETELPEAAPLKLRRVDPAK